jgi:hypothetical protein
VARLGNFGYGTRDGIPYIFWPPGLFKERFADFLTGAVTEDDWKAAVYKWANVLPSRIERTDLQFCPERGGMLLLWWEKKV